MNHTVQGLQTHLLEFLNNGRIWVLLALESTFRTYWSHMPLLMNELQKEPLCATNCVHGE